MLRPFDDGDVEALVALDSDPAVRRFVEDGVPVGPETAMSAIRSWRDHALRHPGFGCWAAADTTSGEFLGWFHLFADDGDDGDDRDGVVGELGYRLRRAVWGRGLATEGSRLLIDHAFRSTTASSVIAEAMAVNAASRRVMEKSGMTLVAEFRAAWPVRIPGDELGDVRYEMTRSAWRTT